MVANSSGSISEKSNTLESSELIRKRIEKGLEFKKSRGSGGATLSSEVHEVLIHFSEKLHLSGRGYHRALRVARTIADLDQSMEIKKNHILEALQYRQRDF